MEQKTFTTPPTMLSYLSHTVSVYLYGLTYVAGTVDTSTLPFVCVPIYISVHCTSWGSSTYGRAWCTVCSPTIQREPQHHLCSFSPLFVCMCVVCMCVWGENVDVVYMLLYMYKLVHTVLTSRIEEQEMNHYVLKIKHTCFKRELCIQSSQLSFCASSTFYQLVYYTHAYLCTGRYIYMYVYSTLRVHPASTPGRISSRGYKF